MHETFESKNIPAGERRQSLIIEHATLAARFASKQEDMFKETIVARLHEIEENLSMSPEYVAIEAMKLYKSQYR